MKTPALSLILAGALFLPEGMVNAQSAFDKFRLRPGSEFAPQLSPSRKKRETRREEAVPIDSSPSGNRFDGSRLRDVVKQVESLRSQPAPPVRRPTEENQSVPSARDRLVESLRERGREQPASLTVDRPSRERVKETPVIPAKTLDAGKMIAILKAQAQKPSASPTAGVATVSESFVTERPAIPGRPVAKPGFKIAPTSPVVDRVVPLHPGAMPKGMGTDAFLKSGKHPAEGSAVAFSKKGKTPAEGIPAPGAATVVRIKDGRPVAESAPPVSHHHHHGDSRVGSDTSFASSAPGSTNHLSASHGHAAAPSVAYRVDTASQLSTDSVKFERGSTALADATSFHYLQTLAAALADPQLAGYRFVVEGHASAEGSESSNLLLSQRRANSIFDYLVGRGINPARLLAVGHGEYQARFRASDPEYLRAQDRQVIVFRLAD